MSAVDWGVSAWFDPWAAPAVTLPVAVAVVGVGLRPGRAAAAFGGRLQPVQCVVGIRLVLIERRSHTDPLAQHVAVVRGCAVTVFEQQQARRRGRSGRRQASRSLSCPQADPGRLQPRVVTPLLPQAVAQQQLPYPSVGLILDGVIPRPPGIPAVDARPGSRDPPRSVVDVVHHPVRRVALRGEVPRPVVGVGHGVGLSSGPLSALQHPPQGVVAVVGRTGDLGCALLGRHRAQPPPGVAAAGVIGVVHPGGPEAYGRLAPRVAVAAPGQAVEAVVAVAGDDAPGIGPAASDCRCCRRCRRWSRFRGWRPRSVARGCRRRRSGSGRPG